MIFPEREKSMKHAFLTVLLSSLPVLSFSLEVDTIFTPQYFNSNYDDSSYIVYRNTGNDTVIIDSMKTREIEVHSNQYHLLYFIEVEREDETFLGMNQFFKDFDEEQAYWSPRSDSLLIAPGQCVKLEDICLDWCCQCDLAKRSAPSALGDPLILELLFYSEDQIDTCVIISKIHTIDISPFREKILVLPAEPIGSKQVYNIQGQLLPAIQQHSGIQIKKINGRFRKDLRLKR